MRNRMKLVRRPGRWMCAAFCTMLIAPLSGCTTAGFVGFTAFNALYASAIGFAPLRSLFGTFIRDTFVGIF